MTISSTVSRFAGRKCTGIAAAAVLLVSPAVGAGVASASASTPREFFSAGARAIAFLDSADKVALTAKTPSEWEQARQLVSDFYYKAYDPELEGPSRALSPVNGRPRKPAMEGYKADAVNELRACAESKPSCSRDEALKTIKILREGVARDVLIMSGTISDKETEAVKEKAAGHFLTSIGVYEKDGIIVIPADISDEGSKGWRLSDEVIDKIADAAEKAARGENARPGHVITDADGSAAVFKSPQAFSSEINSYLKPADDDAPADEQGSSPVVPIIAVVVALGAIAAAAAGGFIPGVTIPPLPGLAH